MRTKVVNKRIEQYDVYIGRGSPFGNPFTLKEYGRREAIDMFRKYFYSKLNNPFFRKTSTEIEGQDTGLFLQAQSLSWRRDS